MENEHSRKESLKEALKSRFALPEEFLNQLSPAEMETLAGFKDPSELSLNLLKKIEPYIKLEDLFQ